MTNPLDQLVGHLWKSLAADSVPRPDVVVSLATGLDLLPERLIDGAEVALADHAELPAPLAAARLYHGRWTKPAAEGDDSTPSPLEGVRVWIVLDGSLEPRLPSEIDVPAWASLVPIWLAAKAGASFLLHASAGLALHEQLEPGTLALLHDHVNFGAPSPLTGLGESELGPLFPDTTHLHHKALRQLAQRVAGERGLPVREALAACVPAPQLDTPAECAFYAKAGADLVVQGLGAPLLAAAHAGLGVLAVSVVLDGPGRELDVRELLERAEQTAPALEELLMVVCGELEACGLLEDEEL